MTSMAFDCLGYKEAHPHRQFALQLLAPKPGPHLHEDTAVSHDDHFPFALVRIDRIDLDCDEWGWNSNASIADLILAFPFGLSPSTIHKVTLAETRLGSINHKSPSLFPARVDLEEGGRVGSITLTGRKVMNDVRSQLVRPKIALECEAPVVKII